MGFELRSGLGMYNRAGSRNWMDATGHKAAIVVVSHAESNCKDYGLHTNKSNNVFFSFFKIYVFEILKKQYKKYGLVTVEPTVSAWLKRDVFLC